MSTTSREVLAEFLGTLVLIVFGVAVVAQVNLGGGSNGQYLSINIAWGLAVMMAVYVSGGVSGGHLNPAVTIAAAAFRRFPWSKVLPFIVAQTAGAFVASAIVFATYPQPWLSTFGGLVDQIVGTALLVGVIFGITDQRNLAPPRQAAPIVVGLLVILIGATFGLNAGYAINPARDFGPRLFTAVAGWGGEVFTAGNGWWWVPIAGPILGGLVGGFIYITAIERLHPAEEPA